MNGHHRRIAARLRAKAQTQRRARPKHRERLPDAVVNVAPPRPEPPRVIFVRDPRLPRSGWGR